MGNVQRGKVVKRGAVRPERGMGGKQSSGFHTPLFRYTLTKPLPENPFHFHYENKCRIFRKMSQTWPFGMNLAIESNINGSLFDTLTASLF